MSEAILIIPVYTLGFHIRIFSSLMMVLMQSDRSLTHNFILSQHKFFRVHEQEANMGLVKRQTSNPQSYTVNYGGFESPRSNMNIYSKSERSFFDDLESEAKIPAMPLKDSRKKKTKSNKRIPQKLIFGMIQYAVFLYVLVRARRASVNLRKTNDNLSVMNEDYKIIQEMLKETELELKQAHNDFLKLQVRVNTMTPHTEIHRGIKNSYDRKILTDTIMDRHSAQAKRINDMQKTIQEIHRRDLIQK